MQSSQAQVSDSIKMIQDLLEKMDEDGRWVLDQVNEAIDSGIEVDTLGKKGPEYIRPESDWDKLTTYIQVILAYFAEGPALFAKIGSYLSDKGIPGFTFSSSEEAFPTEIRIPFKLPPTEALRFDKQDAEKRANLAVDILNALEDLRPKRDTLNHYRGDKWQR